MPQGAAKLQVVKLFSFFKNYIFLFMYHIVIWKQRHLWTLLVFSILKLWQPVTLQPLEAQERVLPFWKPPIRICLEQDCKGGSSIWKVRQAMLKCWGLLIGYYTHLISNAHHCTYDWFWKILLQYPGDLFEANDLKLIRHLIPLRLQNWKQEKRVSSLLYAASVAHIGL